MDKPIVFVTRHIPEEGLEKLREFCEVEVSDYDGVIPREILLRKVEGKKGLLALLTDRIDREVMERAGPFLLVISNYAAGFNNIDVQEATKRGIMVTNTPHVLTETTADFTWALLLTVARRVVEADRFTRSALFQGWDPFLFWGNDVYGKLLGIVGLGKIGKAVAKRAQGFNMKVWYYNRQRLPQEERWSVEYQALPQLLEEADFVTLHVPLTSATYHLIGEKELKLMKKEAYLINTSRGEVVDEKALVRALQEGWIAGAALDVFEKEPQIEKELLELPNVVLTPHIGSASKTTRVRMAIIAAENMLRALQGEIPQYLVNPEVIHRKN